MFCYFSKANLRSSGNIFKCFKGKSHSTFEKEARVINIRKPAIVHAFQEHLYELIHIPFAFTPENKMLHNSLL